MPTILRYNVVILFALSLVHEFISHVRTERGNINKENTDFFESCKLVNYLCAFPYYICVKYKPAFWL